MSPSLSAVKVYSAFAAAPKIDVAPVSLAELDVTGDEVGVEMRQQHVLDAQPALGRKGDVLIDVPLRIHDGRDAGGLVADEIRRVREARQIELVQHHQRGTAVRPVPPPPPLEYPPEEAPPDETPPLELPPLDESAPPDELDPLPLRVTASTCGSTRV